MAIYQSFSRTRFFRNFLFRLLRKEKLPIVSRKLDDHIICFSPSGVIGRHLPTYLLSTFKFDVTPSTTINQNWGLRNHNYLRCDRTYFAAQIWILQLHGIGMNDGNRDQTLRRAKKHGQLVRF